MTCINRRQVMSSSSLPIPSSSYSKKFTNTTKFAFTASSGSLKFQAKKLAELILWDFSGMACCNLSLSVALNTRFITNRMCAKKSTHMQVARTCNNRVIAAHDLYCCWLPQCEVLRTCRSGFPVRSGLNIVFQQIKFCVCADYATRVVNLLQFYDKIVSTSRAFTILFLQFLLTFFLDL